MSRGLFAFVALLASSQIAVAMAQESVVTDEVLKVRDPFKRPLATGSNGIKKGELELYPVESFKLVGVLTGPIKMRAMVLAPNGKTYFVSEAQKIGIRNGSVRRITPEAILVREKIINVIGREEDLDFEIRLPSDQKTLSGAAAGAGG